MRFLYLVAPPMLSVALFAGTAQSQAPPTVWDSIPDSVVYAPGDTLTLAHALARVKRQSPTLAALAQRLRAAEASVGQAGAVPNPTLLFDVENAGGGYSAFDRSEFTLQLEQEFEIGGRRSNRVRMARSAADLAAMEAGADAFALYLAVIGHYAAVTHAEERWRLTESERVITEQLAASAVERVEAGAALVADAQLGAAALERARIAEADARADALNARRALASLWGDEEGFDAPVSRVMGTAPTVPDVDTLAARAADSPAVRSRLLAIESARAGQALEKSLRIPALSASAGVRRIEEDGISTFVFGVGLPLPVFDRRDRAIEAHAADARRFALEKERALTEVRVELETRAARLARMIERLGRTDSALLPAQRSAFESLRTAYAIGRVSYSDLLDAERAYLNLSLERNDLELAIVEEMLAMERLMGTEIQEWKQP